MATPTPNTAKNVVIWERDNCQIPSDVHPSSVSTSIKNVLRNSGFQGEIEIITSFHRSSFSEYSCNAIVNSGIKYTESVYKEKIDVVLKLELYQWTTRNRIPANVFMISGDGGFLTDINHLKRLGYKVHWSYIQESASKEILQSMDPKMPWSSLVKGRGKWGSVGPSLSVASSSAASSSRHSQTKGKGQSKGKEVQVWVAKK